MAEVNTLWDWMAERQRIYHRRFILKSPPPWSDDQIFQEYRFCNVFRELDKVTIWIRENWREPYADHPNLWFAMCMARQINWPDTLAEIGFPDTWNPERVRRVMNDRLARGEQVYTGVYMIYPFPALGQDKAYHTCHTVLDSVFKAADSRFEFTRLQSAFDWLCQYPGWGGFTAYEAVTDIRHTRFLNTAEDIMTWANAGPGAMRGLNRYFGRPVKKKIPQIQAVMEMQQLLAASKDHFDWHLEMRDIEHSLCEYDKYMRVKNGEGRPRNKYRIEI